MTIGIYLLCFGEDQVYVGQSVNIEQRFKSHINSLLGKAGKPASKKIQEAYKKYGLPICSIYQECAIIDLDSREKDTIIEFNSIYEGLNSIDGNTPGGSGYTATTSKYTREQVLEIFNLLCAGYTRPEVVSILEVPTGSVGNIQSGIGHLWLKEEFPEDYDIMRWYAKSRHLVATCNTAKAKGYTYPPIVSPTGEIFRDIGNIAEFARQHSLDRAAISRVMRGKYPVHLGWRIYNGI